MAARRFRCDLLLLAMVLTLGTCKPELSTYRVDQGGSSAVVRGAFSVESMVAAGGACDKMEEYNWYSDFHDCFVDRKYKDGGRDLDAIVDRILNHAEVCVETSKRPCTLDYEGFKFLMNKVIEQMKDFSIMYMEAIIKGRENVKDLECVEDVLTVQSYVECFSSRVPRPPQDEESQSMVQEGLLCANRHNKGCSREAMATFNRIVRTLLGQKHPEVELFVTTPSPTTSTPTTFRPSFEWRTRFHEEEEEEEPKSTPEPPMMWYDYIFQPFISAWNWVKSLFG